MTSSGFWLTAIRKDWITFTFKEKRTNKRKWRKQCFVTANENSWITAKCTTKEQFTTVEGVSLNALMKLFTNSFHQKRYNSSKKVRNAAFLNWYRQTVHGETYGTPIRNNFTNGVNRILKINVINILAIFSHGISFGKNTLATWGLELSPISVVSKAVDWYRRRRFASPRCQWVFSNDTSYINIANILITSYELRCIVVWYLKYEIMCITSAYNFMQVHWHIMALCDIISRSLICRSELP